MTAWWPLRKSTAYPWQSYAGKLSRSFWTAYEFAIAMHVGN